MPAPAGRLVSLDTFRGLTVAAMTLVNNPGTWDAIYEPLEHAPWNGWTPTDLVFPFFLFAVGLSMAFSSKGTFLQALRRSAILFGLGLFMAAFPYFDLSTVRIPGVLARIAVCYLATFVLRRVFGWRGQAAVSAALLVGYWALMTLVPLPDGTPPNLEPSTNLGAFVDRTLFGNHLWPQSKTWDPEGLLSTLPAIVTTLLGSLAGLWLRAEGRSGRAKTFGFLSAGALLIALGLVWNESFPINKGLWTSSYVLFSGGMAAALFGFCYWIADVRGVRGWTRPGVVYGRNAIFVFVASGLFAKTIELVKIDGTPLQTLLYQGLFAAPFGLSAKNASLAYALANVVGWYLVLLVMDRRGLHLSV